MQILAGIILLGVLIAFHELGHFLFAKWLGVRVLVFSIGFGPKIFGFKRGETEYRLSAIPLGGYVRMFGESVEEELNAEEKKGSFLHQPIWRKSLIAFAGPLFNFILPIILFFFLLVGTEKVFAPRVGTLVTGGVAEAAGLAVGDLVTFVNGKPVTSFNEVALVIAKNPNVDVNLGIDRKNADGNIEKINIVVRPEIKASSTALEKNSSVGRIGIMPSVERPLIVVSEKSPLKAAGLHSFDEITAIDDKAITDAASLAAALLHLRPGQKITVQREKDVTETIIVPANLTIDREVKPAQIVHDNQDTPSPEEIIEKTTAILYQEKMVSDNRYGISSANGAINQVSKDSVAERLGLTAGDRIVVVDGEKLMSPVELQQAIVHDALSSHVLGIIKKDGSLVIAAFSLPKAIVDRMNLSSDLKSLFGITTLQVFKPGEMIERRVNPFEAITRASEQTFDIGFLTAKSLWMLVSLKVPASQLGGPIMLFDVAGQAAEKGLPYYIFIMCLLSVNLGLLNLIPIPGLDGGHLLMFGIEAVQRKPLTPRTRTIATQIGIMFLLLIMAIAVFNDLSRLFR